jgi:hypothetical protein
MLACGWVGRRGRLGGGRRRRGRGGGMEGWRDGRKARKGREPWREGGSRGWSVGVL